MDKFPDAALTQEELDEIRILIGDLFEPLQEKTTQITKRC
jgi:hypothetical protein